MFGLKLIIRIVICNEPHEVPGPSSRSQYVYICRTDLTIILDSPSYTLPIVPPRGAVPFLYICSYGPPVSNPTHSTALLLHAPFPSPAIPSPNYNYQS